MVYSNNSVVNIDTLNAQSRGFLKNRATRLNGSEYRAVLHCLKSRIDERIQQGHNSVDVNSLAPENYSNTPFQCLYEVCGGDDDDNTTNTAHKLCGYILHDLLELDSREWDKNSGVIAGNVYTLRP